MRMGRAEPIDRHARREVEIAFAVGCHEPHALPALEREIDARKGRQQMRYLSPAHTRPLKKKGKQSCEMKGAASAGGTRHIFYCGPAACQHPPKAVRGSPGRRRPPFFM